MPLVNLKAVAVLAGAWKVEAAPDCKVIAPAAALPMEIAPVEVPVLMLVA